VFSASWRAALVGALVAALATLPGLGAGTLWDNSETAYSEVAREIWISHSWIVMHLNGAPWFVQPPLYFWIAALFTRAFGNSEFAYRLPSALATIATAAAVGYVVARLTTLRAAVLSATVLSTSLMQAVVGRLAIMDALLDLTVALAILAWFGTLRTGNRAWWYLGCVAVALGTLAKGPVAPAAAVMIVVPWAFWERAVGRRVFVPRALDLAGGALAFGALVLPWALALERAAGGVAFEQMLGHYTVGRYLGTIENQSGPIWYYVPVIVLGFFPWFAYLVPSSIAAWHAAREERGGLARLAIVWAVVPFVFFSFAKTKLPNYIALEMPALAIVVALWFDGISQVKDRRAALWWTAVVPVLIVLLGIATVVFSHDNKLTTELSEIAVPFAALGVAILAGSIACFVLLRSRERGWLAPFALAAANIIVMVIIAVIGEPIVDRFKPIPALAAVIERERRPGDVVAIQSVSGGNGLMFYTRPGIAILNGPADASSDSPNDPRPTICSAPRAFVVTSKRRPPNDPTYGRMRHAIATSNGDVLYLYDGPLCKDLSAVR
jgi:4-amino-4-deoxy-L-arabinose transferase-like glycosyltransferase